jgi:hypothetical protein
VTAAEITDPSRLREPAHPCADPWAIVHVIAADLAAHGIKPRFGAEADFGQAATAGLRCCLRSMSGRWSETMTT